MWNRLSGYLGERAMMPSWYDFIWIVPFYALSVTIGFFIRLKRKVIK